MARERVVYTCSDDPDLFNVWDIDGDLVAVRIRKDEIEWFWERYLANSQHQQDFFENKSEWDV